MHRFTTRITKKKALPGTVNSTPFQAYVEGASGRKGPISPHLMFVVFCHSTKFGRRGVRLKG
jgi:hypothetical protein